MGGKRREINEQQKIFVHRYLVHFNATKACLEAGYCSKNPKNAEKYGHKLLKNPVVQEYLQKKVKEIHKKNIVEAEFVLQKFVNIADLDILDIYDEDGNVKNIKDIPEKVRKCISSIDVDVLTEDGHKVGYSKKVKIESRIQALNSLAKYLKLFIDKKEEANTGIAERVREARLRALEKN